MCFRHAPEPDCSILNVNKKIIIICDSLPTHTRTHSSRLEYVSQVEECVEEEKLLAVALKKLGRDEWATRAVQRMKVMRSEVADVKKAISQGLI